MDVISINAEFAPAYEKLWQPSRYKVYYGGRGGGKSWAFARALLIRGVQQPLRVLCAREFQNSIADSVHRLLSDQIKDLKLDPYYTVEKARILGPNGTEFSFEGIRHNISKIRSFEGVDVCWVEEAGLTTAMSWDVLIPTIRKESSEIWVSFNPELDTDATYDRFVTNTPPNTIIEKVSWRDNPWFSDVLRAEMEYLKTKNYDAYLNVWEGHCRVMLDGAVYAQELRDATTEGRFLDLKYVEGVPVDVFFDLGKHDQTSIWFAQKIGTWFHIIDFFQYTGKHMSYYIKVLQRKQYVYGTVYLPHDAKSDTVSAEHTVEAQARRVFPRVRIVPKLSVEDGINAARTIFPLCKFDSKRCADGVQSLKHYRYEVDPETKRYSKKPLHDWASDAADSFRYLAVSMKTPRSKGDGPGKAVRYLGELGQSLGWMG